MINYEEFYYPDDLVEWQTKYKSENDFYPEIISINFIQGNSISSNYWIVWYK